MSSSGTDLVRQILVGHNNSFSLSVQLEGKYLRKVMISKNLLCHITNVSLSSPKIVRSAGGTKNRRLEVKFGTSTDYE